MACCLCPNKGTKLCGRCGIRRYCSAECQGKDWPEHKLACSPELHAGKEELDRAVETAKKRVESAVVKQVSFATIGVRSNKALALRERTLAEIRALEELPRVRCLAGHVTQHIRKSWQPVLRFFRRECAVFAAREAAKWSEDLCFSVMLFRTDVSREAFFTTYTKLESLDVWLIAPQGVGCVFAKFEVSRESSASVNYRLTPFDVVWGECWVGSLPKDAEALVTLAKPEKIYTVSWPSGAIARDRR